MIVLRRTMHGRNVMRSDPHASSEQLSFTSVSQALAKEGVYPFSHASTRQSAVNTKWT